jgi:threonine dehydratase
LNAVLRLSERADVPAALVTASAGNHGRALAHAAALVPLPLTVYVAEDAPRVKLEAMRAAGATLVLCRDYDDAEQRAKTHGATRRATFISPYSHVDVIAGAGTVALDILADDPDVEAIVAAVGGGGLISGLSIAAGQRAKTYGVEAEASCPFTRGLEAGGVVTVDVRPTLADGLAGNLDPDTITFDIVRQHVAGIATVTEEDIAAAISGLFAEEHLIAEGAAAAAVAGVLSGRLNLRGGRIAIVLSGANIDRATLRQII